MDGWMDVYNLYIHIYICIHIDTQSCLVNGSMDVYCIGFTSLAPIFVHPVRERTSVEDLSDGSPPRQWLDSLNPQLMIYHSSNMVCWKIHQ